MSATPRGIRNKNPGNIDYNPRNDWQGQTGIETGVANPRFATFSDAKYGIRAIAKILRTYHRNGFDTINKMINRWAPPLENQTDSYVVAVARKAGLNPDERIITLGPDVLALLVVAIIKHENGENPYDPEKIEWAIGSALQ